MANLEKIVGFDALTRDLTEENKRKVADVAQLDYTESCNRIVGFHKEDEIITILQSLKLLKSCVAFDERFSYIADEPTPDFKIELPDGYKMFLEVKSTNKDQFKISNGRLDKQMNFAKEQNIPLRFAVCLKGFWGLFTAEDLKDRNGKLTLNDFLGERSISWLDEEFETCSYMFEKPLQIKSVYSHNSEKGMGIFHEPYGELISYELHYDGRRIFRAKGKKSLYFCYSIVLEVLQDSAASVEQTIKRDGDFTIVLESTEKKPFQILPEYIFFLAPIAHMVDGKEIPYSPSRILDNKESPPIDVALVRCILHDLATRGVEIFAFKGSTGLPLIEFSKRYWTKSER